MTHRKHLMISLIIILGLFLIVIGIYSYYIGPVSRKDQLVDIKIESGMSNREIGNLLYEKKLIKNTQVFLFYLKLNQADGLKAGSYKLNQNMSLKKIIEVLQKGNSYSEDTIKILFKEGINFRDVARLIDEKTDNSYEDVMNLGSDQEYLKSLIDEYWFLTEEILDSKIYYPLEGYLFPDTYEFKSKKESVKDIFKKLLDRMDVILTSYKSTIEGNEYSVHELLTLASIAEKEVSIDSDRAKVISVFLNRIKKHIPLGSDITTRYGLKLDDTRALYKSEYNSLNAYNTRNSNFYGLPASPICMISKESIEASINPAETNYLYFISNIKTKETFFFERSQEFEAKKKELAKVNQGY